MENYELYISNRTFLLARMAYYQEQLMLAETMAQQAEYGMRLDQVEAALADLDSVTSNA